MNEEIKNDGYIHIPLKEAEEAGDHFLGASIPFEVNVPDGDWTKYLPTLERQSFRYFDSMGCVSFSVCNPIEFQINRLMPLLDKEKLGMWIDENGLFNGSDRGLAKQSGTRPNGNSFAKVGDTARHKGIIPERLWSNPKYEDKFDWQDYYKDIPESITKWGLKFLDYFEIRYERLRDIRKSALLKELKQCPIQIASKNHATCIYAPNNDYKQLDHYNPYLREIKGEKIWAAQKIVVIPKPLILKPNNMPNYQPRLVQETGNPKIYWEDLDGYLHHIEEEPFAFCFFGSDYYAKFVNRVSEIDNSKIKYPIGDRSLISVIKNLFTK